MDLFDFPNWAPGKVAACDGFDFRRVRAAANVLRTWLEVFVGLSFLLWAVHSLPFAVKISGECFRRVAAVVSTPLFVFIFGNAIVATIIANSRGGGGGNGEDCTNGSVGKSEVTVSTNVKPDLSVTPPTPAAEDALVYDEKRIIALSQGKCEDEVDRTLIELTTVSEPETINDKACERETVKEESELFPEDKLSDAEFQRAIDEFIAKHLKLRRDESLAIVVNPNPQLVEPIWS